MQEFWFCASCKSMNRGTTDRCCRCNAEREQSTLATVAERPQGVVLIPGLDEEHREVAWPLTSTHRYISAWLLGYVSAGLLILCPILVTLAIVDLVAMVISYDLLNLSVTHVPFDPGQVQLLALLWLAAGVVCFVAVTVQLARRRRVREKWVMSGADRARARFAGVAAAPAYGSGPMPGVAPQSAFAQPVRIAPSPVGAKPISRLPIPTELPPDDMTPDWSRPVFSIKAATEPPPAWTPPPVPKEADPPAWPRPAQQFAPLASDELPSAWRRAVSGRSPSSAGQSGAGARPPAGPAPLAPFNRPAWANPPAPIAPEVLGATPADRSVIQPSSNSLLRYRPPVPPSVPQEFAGDHPSDVEPGEGS
jgi:hypothetical protein